MPVQPSLRARTAVLIALVVSLFGSLSAVGASPASAYSLGDKAVAVAAAQKGDPYVYGADGPSSFDCSGLTKYVYGKLGKYLPHSSTSQYSSSYVTHLSQSSKAPGDIIFMHSGGSIYHVGIYAGSGKWWVAAQDAATSSSCRRCTAPATTSAGSSSGRQVLARPRLASPG